MASAVSMDRFTMPPTTASMPLLSAESLPSCGGSLSLSGSSGSFIGASAVGSARTASREEASFTDLVQQVSANVTKRYGSQNHGRREAPPMSACHIRSRRRA